MITATQLPEIFTEKSPVQIRNELIGFSFSCVEAVIRCHENGEWDGLDEALPGFITFHLPRGAAPPPEPLEETMRLKEDLGLDSLALTEMAFKLEDLFGIHVETRDVFTIQTVGELKSFLKGKLESA